MIIFENEHYWLKNAHIPRCLLENQNFDSATQEDLCLVDLEIKQGNINKITQGDSNQRDLISIDLQKKIIFPCFIDVHTHLDKGHIW